LLLDAVALAGLAALVRGVDLIYRPAAWILGGLVVFLGAAALSRAPAAANRSER
jgi:hypothetical protein